MIRIAVVGALLLGVTALIIFNPLSGDPARGMVESLEEMAQAVEAHSGDCDAMADALTAPAARYEEAAKALAGLAPADQKTARERYTTRVAGARNELNQAVNCAMNRRVRDTLVNRL